MMNKLINGALKLGLSFSDRQIGQFEAYYRELTDWNQRVNLTAITDYDEVQVRHFLDSLTVISAIRSADRAWPLKVIDVGSGAGLPGLPLKIALPQIHLTLLEATAKKTKFLDYLVRQLGLKDVTVVTGRAEDAARDPTRRESFNIAVSRAVAPLPVLAELALPFCAVGGYLIAQKKGDIEEEVGQSRKAIATLGGFLSEIRPVELEGLKDNRMLVIIDKVKPAPPAYPRRPGIPARRPIKD